jgi:dihydropteroate synthase
LDATPSVRLPEDAPATGLPARPPRPISVRGSTFTWGTRTFLMGIVNVTPDSFSGDGLLAAVADGGIRPGKDAAGPHAAGLARAIVLGRRMALEGADILDVGGESTRPGHANVDEAEELRRAVPVIRALRGLLPDQPISVDTIKPGVADAAVDAGADLINDIWGTGSSDAMARVAAERGVPYVISHNRAEPIYRSIVAEVVADLERAVERAVRAGCPWESLIVDPGIGFGKTAEQNLELLRGLDALRALGRPILLGASRKSTIGKVLDLPADQRLEGTLATTALGVAAGVDIVRVHDVEANLRAARMSDAVIRGGWHPPPRAGAGP